MANEVVKSITEDIARMDTELGEAESLIRLAQDAGEDVTGFKAEVEKLKVRKRKWEQALKAYNRSPAPKR